ncbi:MAG: response regulator [Nitrospiria bacterium]
MGLFNTKKKILIVDDSESIRNTFSQYVPGEMEVYTAEDGAQGLNKLMTHKPDLIFSDLGMPNMDGFKFIAAIRKMEKFSKIPIVVISASEIFFDVNKALDLGANDYIEKNSINSDKLRAKINKFI